MGKYEQNNSLTAKKEEQMKGNATQFDNWTPEQILARGKTVEFKGGGVPGVYFLRWANIGLNSFVRGWYLGKGVFFPESKSKFPDLLFDKEEFVIPGGIKAYFDRVQEKGVMDGNESRGEKDRDRYEDAHSIAIKLNRPDDNLIANKYYAMSWTGKGQSKKNPLHKYSIFDVRDLGTEREATPKIEDSVGRSVNDDGDIPF